MSIADQNNPDPWLSPRDGLDALIHLNNLHVERFNQRRNWEWRVTFTFWAGLAFAANALRGLQIDPWWFWPGLAVVVAMHWSFEYFYVRREARKNRDIGIRISQKIEDVIGHVPAGFPWKKPWYRRKKTWERLEEERLSKRASDPAGYNDWAHYWQVVVTVLLGLVVAAAIYFPRIAP